MIITLDRGEVHRLGRRREAALRKLLPPDLSRPGSLFDGGIRRSDQWAFVMKKVYPIRSVRPRPSSS